MGGTLLGCLLVLSLLSYAACVAPRAADPPTKFTFTNFTSPLPGPGNIVANGHLILTSPGSFLAGSSAWFQEKIQVRGFRTTFTYTISNNSKSLNSRPDGIAFVIQNNPNGLQEIGAFGGGLGYGLATQGNSNGIRNSVAIEFDSWHNPELGDPNGFHISIHSDGANPNSAYESKRIGNYVQFAPNFQLDVQLVEITYDPRDGGTMSFSVNNGIVQSIPNVSLEKLTSLDPTLGSAYVGFTAGSHQNGTAFVETIAVTNWEFEFLGQFDPTNTIVDGIEPVVAGNGLSFSVQAVDQYNYSMITDAVNDEGFVLSATLVQPDLSQQTVSATYSGVGKYVIIINATIAGNATVKVNLNNTAVGNGVYNLVVSPADPYAPLSYPYGFSQGVDSPGVAGVIGTCFVQLRDRYGNNITTSVAAPVLATIKPNFASDYSLQVPGVYNEALGLYVITYNVTLSGNFTLQVTVNGDGTSAGTRTLQIIPADVAPTTSVLYGTSSTALAGVMQYAYLQLKDIFGNNASNADVPIFVQAFQDSVRVNGTVVDKNMGLCTISFNLTVASYNGATYSLVVLVNDVPVVNSNTVIEVDPAPFSPTVSYAYGQGLTVSTAGEYGYFYIQLTDTFGNNQSAPLASVTATLTPSSGPPTTPTRVSSSDTGLYVYQYSVTVATTYALTIMVNGDQVVNGVNNVLVSPNVVSPPNCVGFGEGLSGSVEVGVNHVFYVQLRDAFQNNINTNGSEVLVVDISHHDNETYLYAQATFIAGLYEVTYNITLAADFNITITVNDIPIFNAAQNLTLFPGAVYPAQCVASNVATSVVAGATNQLQIQLRDVYANDITEVLQPDGIVTASFTSATGGTTVDITYSGSGLYVLSYNATLAASYTLTILVNSTAIQGGGQYPVQVVPAAAYPPNCRAQGDALTKSVAGAISTFTINLFDVYNNPITAPNPPDTPVVTIDTQTVSVEFSTEQGFYVANYNITTSAAYTLTVTVDNTQIASGTLTVIPAALYVPNCLANGTSLLASTAGNFGQFYVFQRDQFGNVIYDYAQITTFAVVMTLNGIQYTPTITQNGDGSYTVSYNITAAGSYSTQVLVNQGNILGSPFTTAVSAAAFDPHGTITNGLALNVVAGNLNIFTIQLRDVYGNNVTDENMPNPVTPGSIAVSLNSTYIAITPTLLPAGVIQVTYNFTKAGKYWMNVTINGTDVGTSPPGWVMIQPNTIYPLACRAAGDSTSEAVVRKTNTFALYVRDAFNNTRTFSNPADDLRITLTANGLPTVVGSASNQTQPDGSYVLSYFIDEKVVYSMSVTFGSVHIYGSPFSVDANYGNNSAPTAVIVGCVIGGIVLIAAIIGGIFLYKRRRMEYVVLS